jgi:hypothetical protein
MGRTMEDAEALIRGNVEIDVATARRLSEVLGTSERFWINREQQYRTAMTRLRTALDPSTQLKWLDQIPVNDMVSFGWLDPLTGIPDKALKCLRFFGVATIDAWNERCEELLQATTFRTSHTFKSHPGAVAAWLRQGELEAASIDCKGWDRKKFRAALDEIRLLTREDDPKVFLPMLLKRCTDCGVAVVVLKAPSGCRASGASRILPTGHRMILLSARYLSDDQFWFTFFHEAGHLILHGDHPLFIDSLDEVESSPTKEEEEANSFAADILIPSAHQEEMSALPLDGRQVMRFARRIGIAPGIVVGQLQHLGIFTHRQLNNLKRRFEWET